MDAVLEIIVHLDHFENIDLFRQGLYHIRVKIYNEKKNIKEHLAFPYHIIKSSKHDVKKRIYQPCTIDQEDNEFFQNIESSANFINSFNKLSTVATLDTLSNTKLTPVSDRDVKLVREGQTQVTDAASTFLTNIVYTDAISLIESEKIAYARLFKQDRGYKKGSDRDFNTEFNTEGALRLRNKILKESSYSPDQIYEEAKVLGFVSDYEKYTGDVTDFSPFALASAKASLDMGGKSEYSRFYNSQIPIDKDKNITTTKTGELDGDTWQEKYPGLDKKIQDLENNKKSN